MHPYGDEEAARVCGRGWQQYMKWREAASGDANRRAKLTASPVHTHPFLRESGERAAPPAAADRLALQIRNYTPKGTILELSAKNDSPMYNAMKMKKLKHGKLVQTARDNRKLQEDGIAEDKGGGPRGRAAVRDEHYIPHAAPDHHTEAGMAVQFAADAEAAQLELGGDGGGGRGGAGRPVAATWDRKRKKMVHVDPDGGRKMIRTESGARVPASYRSGRYAEWRKKNGAAGGHPGAQAGEGDDHAANGRKPVSEFRPRWVKHNERVARRAGHGGQGGPELRDKQQIVKDRIRREKVKAKLKHKTKNNKNKKKKK